MSTISQIGSATSESAIHCGLNVSLAGKKALVTGASRGIGAAIATALSEAGADVALLARSQHDLDRLAADLRTFGNTIIPISCDVTDVDAVDAACDAVLDRMEHVDILVNNAGGPLLHAPALELGNHGWQNVLDLNLTSVFVFSRNIGAAMVARGTGTIINIASIVSLRSMPYLMSYCVAKAGVVSLTQALASEWGQYGVRVNAISPGFIKTDLNRALFENPEFGELAVETAPMGRWGQPEDVVGAVLWLASEASRYVTGANIAVDGGIVFGVRSAWLDAFSDAVRSSVNDKVAVAS